MKNLSYTQSYLNKILIHKNLEVLLLYRFFQLINYIT